MVGLVYAMAFVMLLLVGWVIWNNKPYHTGGPRLSCYGSLSAGNDQEKLAMSGLIPVKPDCKNGFVRVNPCHVKLQKVACRNEVLPDSFVKIRL